MSIEISEFLESFFPDPLHHRAPEFPENPWVFWSQSENNSSSADLGTWKIQEKIISVFCKIADRDCRMFFGQFWAPVTISGRGVLSTSGQPFAVSYLSNNFAKYKLYSSKYKYNIDVNKPGIEPDHMIMSGGPATAFLNRLANMNHIQWIPSESYEKESLNYCIMLPICFPSQSQSSCVGVLEFTLDFWSYYLGAFVLDVIRAVKKAGLDVFRVANLIPYKTLNDLKPTKDEIEEALNIVCGSHNLALAQVWITYEDKNNMPSSYSLEDAPMKRLLGLKLTGYLGAVTKLDFDDYQKYYSLCDVIPHGVGEKVAFKTLQDYESRYVSNICTNILVDWDSQSSDSSALVICLRSTDTGDFDYAFEFVWTKHSDYLILFEALLLTLKRCLPSFRFASGTEIGDKLDVLVVHTSTNNDDDETIDECGKFKIFRGKRSTTMAKALEEGTKSMVVDYIAPSEVTCCKTTPKELPLEIIEKQFGKTMKEAAKSLHVSESTLKRKLRNVGITEWPGPNFVKRKASTININQNTLTIKAEYADDMIKFHLPILQATFEIIEKEIGMKFKLCLGTYKLKYHDEVGEWILLTSNEEMSYCIESSRKLYQNEVRLRVLPSTQPIFGPSYHGICST